MRSSTPSRLTLRVNGQTYGLNGALHGLYLGERFSLLDSSEDGQGALRYGGSLYLRCQSAPLRGELTWGGNTTNAVLVIPLWPIKLEPPGGGAVARG